MGRPSVSAILALLMIVCAAALGPARAAPPTVTPSPGYDARLQEQRKAASTSTSDQPSATANAPATVRRHRKRTHRH